MYNQYLKSKWWSDTKSYFKILGKKRCFVCRNNKDLNLHHKHYRTVGYEDGSELVWLCGKHHKEVHFKLGFFESPETPELEKKLWLRLRIMRGDIIKEKKELKIANEPVMQWGKRVKIPKFQKEIIRCNRL